MRWMLLFLIICNIHLTQSQSRFCGNDFRYDSVAINKIESQKIQTRNTITIPVVFHFVLQSDRHVPTRAEILHQLDVVNADFAGQGDNVHKLQSEFIPIKGQSMLQFCLAKTDPFGNSTEGFTVTSTNQDDIAFLRGEEGRYILYYDQLGGKTGWDTDKYVNVWVAEYGDFLGYASMPDQAPFPEEQGIVINVENFGTTRESFSSTFFNRGHTLTHEMGHYFGLLHTWGQGLDPDCNDDDGIEDTPRSAGPYYNCPSGIHASCGSNDMYQNFMELTDDRCLAAFTIDQVERMESVHEEYYPNVRMNELCVEDVQPDTFLNNLVWSFDIHTDSYLIYNENIPITTLDVYVYSVDGKLVHSGSWERQFVYRIDLSRMTSGVFIVAITDGNEYYTHKIWHP